jgi:hypothetical protein
VKELAALALLCTAALAQEPLREGSIGEVRGADKKPFAGATVHLLHRAHPGVLDPAYEDHVVATADERGQFKVQLLVGMPYVVWAVGPVVDGTYRCTEVLSDVVPGVPIVLHEGELHYLRKLALQVDASWPRPLSFVARGVVGENTLLQEVSVVDHKAELPVWPVGTCWIRAIDDGACVYYQSVQMTSTALRNSLKLPEEELRQTLTDTLRIDVPLRRDFAVRFVDDHNKAVANIDVITESRPIPILPRERLGTTDKDGVLHTATAGPEDLAKAAAEVLTDGFAETWVRDVFKPAGEEPKSIVLSPGISPRGRLLLGDGMVAARTPLLLHAAIRSDESTLNPLRERVLQTADDGALVLPGRVPGFAFHLTALLTPAQRATLSPGKSAPPLWPRAILRLEQDGESDPLGDLRLDQLAAVDIQVLADDHSPPGAVQLTALAVPKKNGFNWPNRPERMVTDRHGRLRFLLPRDSEIVVVAMTPRGAAMANTTPARRRLDLTLDPRHAVTLRLVDNEGKPLARAYVEVVVPVGQAETDDDAKVASVVRNSTSSFPWHSGVTDSNGQVQLVMPLLGFSLDTAVKTDDQRWMRTLVRVPIDRGTEPVELVFAPNQR